MKNTVFQAVAPKAPAVIPLPPGGGSWRWDGIKWVANTPEAEPNVIVTINGSMPPGAVIDPHQAASATPAAD